MTDYGFPPRCCAGSGVRAQDSPGISTTAKTNPCENQLALRCSPTRPSTPATRFHRNAARALDDEAGERRRMGICMARRARAARVFQCPFYHVGCLNQPSGEHRGMGATFHRSRANFGRLDRIRPEAGPASMWPPTSKHSRHAMPRGLASVWGALCYKPNIRRASRWQISRWAGLVFSRLWAAPAKTLTGRSASRDTAT